jgi:hypothetical protein
MRSLTWNDNLGVVAQNWANQCLFEHDSNENRQVPGFGHVGQNIYSSSWYSPDNMTHDVFESGINGWFQESSNYPSNLISSFVFQQHGPMTGHFTQVVWAETEQVLKHYCFILHCLLFLIIYKKLFRLVVV